MNTIKERPILFGSPMVRAILDGRKTQTRRIFNDKSNWHFINGHGELSICPYGQPGDRLWVRETWQHSNYPLGPLDKDCMIFYRADYFDDPHGIDGEKSHEGKYRYWKPSIHMPRWASRINLEITSVRVEKLHGISNQDCWDEGCNQHLASHLGLSVTEGQEAFIFGGDARMTYKYLWESINGPGSWDANPWVWVIEFKRVTE